MNAQEIRELFKGHDVSLGAKDVWEVQGTPVIKHSALERLAAALKIRFDPPTVLRAERDEAVILTVGRLGDVSEWSVGEALVNVNYRVSGKMAAYVYAMAEKRSKDRVILKLANLHGAYSEEEADDFKNSAPAQPARVEQAGGELSPPASPSADASTIEEEMTSAETLQQLNDVMKRRMDDIGRLSENEKANLRRVAKFKGEALKKFGEAA